MAISYHVKAYFKQWKIKAEDSGTTAQVPGSYAGYLQDCWKFTPSDPTIKDLANRIAGNTTNVFQKVQQVYTYVNQNIAYLSNSPEEPKSPTRTLSDRNGDCDDQSFFMGSLLRAQGVPAWLELGILYDQSQRHWGGHAWMQVYIPLKNGGAEVVNIDPANDQFLFRDAYRMTDYVDNGNIDDLQSYYISWRYSYTGAPPVRDDRWDAIYFHPSEDSVPMEKSGASAGAAAAKDLWKMPGFDLDVMVMAAVGASAIITLRRRRAA
jgi:transglutaminase-like putative cysteine protease